MSEKAESNQSTPSPLVSTQAPPSPLPDKASAQSPPNHVPQPIADNMNLSAPVGVTPAQPVGCGKVEIKTAVAADDADAAQPVGVAIATPIKPLSQVAQAASQVTGVVTTPTNLGVSEGELSCFVKCRMQGRFFAVLKGRGFLEALAIGSPELNARIRANTRKKGLRLKQRDIDEINENLCSEAEESATEVDLLPRVSPLADGGVEIDLCDGAGTTVSVTVKGVEVLNGTSMTLFLRPPLALALPKPASYGDFKRLHAYLNLKHADFYLYIAWLTFSIASPKIAASKYVFLVLRAMQGAGKSFASKVTKRLVDPSSAEAQMLPGNPKDLAIALQASHLLVIDNLRDLSVLMSDTLCIAATGGTMTSRQLYTDDGQKALNLHGVVLFNGIHPAIGQSDLADRCLILFLAVIPPEARKSEAQMLKDFEADYPVILRGLYDVISKILQNLPDAKVVAPSRMLDFCRWLAAMELSLGMPEGALQYNYADSIKDAQLESLLDNPLAATILEFVQKQNGDEWVGTPTDLYDALTGTAEYSLQRSRAWPSSAAVLSKRLHGLQAPLLAQGISLDWTRGKDRQIVLRSARTTSAASDTASQSPQV